MKNYKYIIIILIISMILSLLGYFNYKEDAKKSISFLKKREINELAVVNKLPIDYNAYFMLIKNENLYVVNTTNQKINTYDLSGNIIKTMNSKGGAPNENKQIYSYYVDENYYYTFDISKNSINKVDFNNNLYEFYTGKLKIEQALHINNNNFIVTSKSDDGFMTFNDLDIETKKTKVLPELTKVFNKVEYNWWLYEGRFCKYNSELFYITYYSNDIVKFDINGKVIFKVKLIHKTPLIKIKKVGEIVFPSEDSFMSVIDFCVYGNYIYILSNISDKTYIENKGKRVIDVYSSKNGAYIKSYIIKEVNSLPLEIEVNNKNIYVLFEEKIISYEL